MPEAQTPSSIAAATRIMLDAVKNIFGAAIIVLLSFGLALVCLASGFGNLESTIRGDIMYLLVWLMASILLGLVLLRIFKPTGLSGPIQPETDEVSIRDTKFT